MKKEKISEIISNIDESFIEESAMAVKKKIPVYKYVSIAACLAIMIIAGIFISQSDFTALPPVNTGEKTSNESGGGENKVTEIAPAPEIVTEPAIETVTGGTSCMKLPPWDALTTSEKYREVTLSGITYRSQVQKIDEASVLSFIEDTTMQGYDPYEDKTYTENAKIYSIRSISTECAVAVKIGTEDEYYVYVNSYYEPDTLGDFISDLDLKNTVSFRKAYTDEYNYFENGSGHKQRIYADFDDSVIWNMLEDVLDAKNVEYNHPYDRIGVETDLPLLGYKNISFAITPDGYVITNILNTQKCFFIGAEKFTRFDEYLKNNVPFKEEVNVYENNPDGTIPGKGEEAQSTPGYNPNDPMSIPPSPPENTPSGEEKSTKTSEFSLNEAVTNSASGNSSSQSSPPVNPDVTSNDSLVEASTVSE